MSYAEIKALATGNPYIKEKMTLENDLARLKVLRTNHAKQKYRLEDELNRGFPERIQKKQEQLAAGTEDLGAWNKNRMQNADNFQMQVGGRWYTEKKDAGEALLQIRNELKLSMEDQKVGEYQGLTVGFHYSPFIECHIISLGQSIRIEMGSDARGNIQRMDHAISALPETVKKLEGELISLNAQRERAKEEVKNPFREKKNIVRNRPGFMSWTLF